MVLEDLGDVLALGQPLGEDIHLVSKVTEDDVAVSVGVLGEDVQHGDGLAGVRSPVGPCVARTEGAAHALDVALRVAADLAEAHEELDVEAEVHVVLCEEVF